MEDCSNLREGKFKNLRGDILSTRVVTFKGGIHPPTSKELTNKVEITEAKPPKEVVLPLSQHIGAPCAALVSVGDEVCVGQKIGEADAFVSAPVHSSVSGTVKAIQTRDTVMGKGKCIVIESDGKFTVHESVKPKGSIESLSADELKSIVKECGLTGMGGASFPTHVKLSPNKPIDTFIVNGAECEPYLTDDHRVMVEKPDNIVLGVRAIAKILGVKKSYIAIETNKPDGIEVLTKACEAYPEIEVIGLQPKYPQGDEKRLINAVTGREVPSGGLPMDAGCVVDNIGTVCTFGNTIKTGIPLVERVVTVTGNIVKEPKNLLVKLGTNFQDLIDQCGGLTEPAGKIISGGPMMGNPQWSTNVPVVKATSSILILSRKEAILPEPSNCIRCGKCIEACPVHLQPLILSKLAERKNYKEADKYNAADCIECGSCSYVCPAKRRLVENIRVAKREVIAMRRKQKK